MRKFGFTAVLAASVLAIGTGASAAASITFLDTGLKEVSSFAHVQDVRVTFSNTPSLCQGNGITWTFEVVETAADESENVLASDAGAYTQVQGLCAAGDEMTETLENVTFLEPGVYTMRATMRGNAAVTVADGEDTLELIEESIEEEIIVSFPAAPSVAARLLSENEAQARYGSGRNGGNHIADVAAKMGPGTDFDGVGKRDVAQYRAAVDAFLEGKGAY